MKSVKFNSVYIRLLKNRNFAVYLAGQIISVFSDSCFKIALMWHLASKSGALTSIAGVMLVSYLPMLVGGLFGGYIVDRYDRKKLMLLSELVSFGALLLFFAAVKTQAAHLSHIILIRFTLSLMDVFYSPAARAYLPKLVPEADLAGANLLFSAVYNVLNIVSAGAAGVIVAAIGLENTALLNALAYLAAGLCILSIPVSGKLNPPKPGKPVPKALLRGFSEIFRDRFLRQFTSIVLLTNIVYDVVYTLLAVYAKSALGSGVEGFGILQTAVSAGMIAGALAVGLLKVKSPGNLFVFGTLVQGALLLLVGVNTSLPLAAVLIFAFAVTDALATPLFARFQTYPEDGVRGRVFTAFDMLALLSTPAAAAVIRASERIGRIGLLYIACGLFLLLSFVLFLNFGALRENDPHGKP